MAAHAASEIRLPMSWGEYNQLGDDVRGEFINGALLMAPTPDRGHQEAILHLVSRLSEVCTSGESVTTGWGWSPAGVTEEYVPDVMVYPTTDDQVRFTGIPVLCVEVTSGNWANDLILKRAKYAKAGLKDYWIADRRERLLRRYELRGDLLVEVEVLSGSESVQARFAGRPVGIELGVLLQDR